MRTRNILLALVKIAVAGGSLAYVFYRIDMARMLSYFRELHFPELLVMFACVTLTYLTGALRMRYFFKGGGLPLTLQYSVMLYYIGAFFNYVLPGGIGGDGYRIYHLAKRSHIKPLRLTQLVIADRLSGLFILALFCLTGMIIIASSRYIWFVLGDMHIWVGWVLIALMLGGSAFYFFAARFLLSQKWSATFGGLIYSIGVQGFSTLLFLVILHASGQFQWPLEYTVIFLAAYVAGTLPISIGGLGVRELVCFWGAGWSAHYLGIPLDSELSIALSLAFYFVSLSACLPGILFFFLISKARMNHVTTP